MERLWTPATPQVALHSVSAYDAGRWMVILHRPRRPTQPPQAAVMDGETFTAIAVIVWDGGNAGARAVSPWVDVALEPARR